MIINVQMKQAQRRDVCCGCMCVCILCIIVCDIMDIYEWVRESVAYIACDILRSMMYDV